MLTVLFIISGLLTAFSVFLWWQVQEHRKVIQQMLEDNELDPTESDPELVLTLRIQDPITLAKRESRSARILADRLPVMVTKMVYQEVMNELEQELQSREIDVDMRIEYR